MNVHYKWHQYSSIKPSHDGFYLISVKESLILKLGLMPSPPILIARYTSATNQWQLLLGETGIGYDDLAHDIISWCEIPRP
jgi:hypothetical protein